jgi:uncharacterized protein (DUF488 family)
VILYTIGHSNIEIEKFILLLKSVNIEVLTDVRSTPYSRYAAQFNKESLKAYLEAEGIKYLYLGDMLGGRPKDSDCYINGAPDYDCIRIKEHYKKGIERLIKGIEIYKIAIMCSEEDPMQCHRRNLIGLDIHRNAIEVVHIRANALLQRDDFSPVNAAQEALF